jgi:hypothetical protein
MANPKLGYCKCGSDDLSYHERVEEACSVGYKFLCDTCGKTGIEWYDLEYSETVMDGED